MLIAPPSKVARALRNTGKTVIVRGQSGADGNHLGAAVCIFEDSAMLKSLNFGHASPKSGLARLVQVAPDLCAIDITVSGLSPGQHGVHIHELGDISRGAESTGRHFNPTGVDHGEVNQGHVGDLGNIMVREDGWGDLLVESRQINIQDIIGRSMVVSELPDDLGRGTDADAEQSKKDGNSGPGVLCGIIARSAGAFQNSKQVCACSGKTLWEEARTSNM
ncbi:copper chaperone [Dimargaris verticillata]|uniref:Copper chaperone n=1 Tax=Dimargaris verticillata TaxID=2761393 RepID=A0A9W8B4N1_9FUNG|nr:copper chaperone [Dimargaris verticillata]